MLRGRARSSLVRSGSVDRGGGNSGGARCGGAARIGSCSGVGVERSRCRRVAARRRGAGCERLTTAGVALPSQARVARLLEAPGRCGRATGDLDRGGRGEGRGGGGRAWGAWVGG